MAHEATDPVDDPEFGERTIESPQTETGLEENVAGALTYLLGVLTGVLFFVLEKDNEFVRFHSAQSIVVFGGLLVASVGVSILSTVLTTAFVGGGGASAIAFGLLSLVISLVWFAVAVAGFGLWIYLMVRAYQGETPRVPIAAGIADGLV